MLNSKLSKLSSSTWFSSNKCNNNSNSSNNSSSSNTSKWWPQWHHNSSRLCRLKCLQCSNSRLLFRSSINSNKYKCNSKSRGWLSKVRRRSRSKNKCIKFLRKRSKHQMIKRKMMMLPPRHQVRLNLLLKKHKHRHKLRCLPHSNSNSSSKKPTHPDKTQACQCRK